MCHGPCALGGCSVHCKEVQKCLPRENDYCWCDVTALCAVVAHGSYSLSQHGDYCLANSPVLQAAVRNGPTVPLVLFGGTTCCGCAVCCMRNWDGSRFNERCLMKFWCVVVPWLCHVVSRCFCGQLFSGCVSLMMHLLESTWFHSCRVGSADG